MINFTKHQVWMAANSLYIAARIGTLSAAKLKIYNNLRAARWSIEEALNIVAPLRR